MRLKSELYVKERKQILDKMLEILEITDTNKMFYLCDLDENPDKQKAILDLKTEIPKFFSCSTWACYKNNENAPKIKREYIALVRSVLKDMDIKYQASTGLIKRNNESKRTQIYILI
jgi:hypothetical protein